MQAAEALPPVIRLAADVAAGGDTKKLFEMMEKGLLDPNTLIPAITKRMKEESDPIMESFWESLRYHQGLSQRTRQNFIKQFLKEGAEEGLTTWFKTLTYLMDDSTGNAATLGKAFKDLSYILSGVVLAGKELSEWLNGTIGKPNIWESMFGEADKATLLQRVREATTEFKSLVTDAITLDDSVFKDTLMLLGEMLEGILKRMSIGLRLMQDFNKGGITGVMEGMNRESYRADVEKMVRESVAELEAAQRLAGNPNYKISESDINKIIADYMSKYDSSKTSTPTSRLISPSTTTGADRIIEDVALASATPAGLVPLTGFSASLRSVMELLGYYRGLTNTPSPPTWGTPPNSPLITSNGLAGANTGPVNQVIAPVFNYNIGTIGIDADLPTMQQMMEAAAKKGMSEAYGEILPSTPQGPN